jgi:hypothetical protein
LATEIPEDVLRPIEESARIHDFASIDDYTSFLDKLTFDQAQPMYRENTRESDFAFKFSTRSLDYCYLSLKLWGMLSPEQKKSAQSAGLSLNTISGEQNKALIEIWIDQIWKGRIPADLWPSVFASGAADLQPVLTCRLRVNSSEDATFDYRLSTGFSFGQVFDVQQAH